MARLGQTVKTDILHQLQQPYGEAGKTSLPG